MSDIGNEIRLCARYGEDDDLKSYLSEKGMDHVNDVDDMTGNTALHMACANGHLGCADILVEHQALHLSNKEGNFPLHWAVQNGHKEIVQLLLKSYIDIDVLARNGFGKGSLTEAFKTENTDIVEMLLEHKSATEELLVKGTSMEKGIGNSQDQEQPESEAESSSSGIKILQEAELKFSFDSTSPNLIARELALNNATAFGTKADEDTTGVTIWSASLILCHWILEMKDKLKNKHILELGAGCGVSGIAAYLYTQSTRVVISDLFPQTVKNLQHNVELNRVTKPATVPACDQCRVEQKFSTENPTGKLLFLCARCEEVYYCSRECQKLAWKRGHKQQCGVNSSIEVASIDWAEPTSWPAQGSFDILLGSDLVYHEELVQPLIATISHVLKSGGQFFHIASQERHSVAEFKERMEQTGFTCAVDIVPDRWKTNCLVTDSSELFDLHFNEMEDLYCMYTFTKL